MERKSIEFGTRMEIMFYDFQNTKTFIENSRQGYCNYYLAYIKNIETPKTEYDFYGNITYSPSNKTQQVGLKFHYRLNPKIHNIVLREVLFANTQIEVEVDHKVKTDIVEFNVEDSFSPQIEIILLGNHIMEGLTKLRNDGKLVIEPTFELRYYDENDGKEYCDIVQVCINFGDETGTYNIENISYRLLNHKVRVMNEESSNGEYD